jgi:hypothetical protein
MSEVRLTTSLRRRDVAVASFRLLVLHPVSLLLMAAGPIFLIVGAASGAGTITRLGLTMSWLILLVPVFGLFAATYNAYRPGATAVYEPAEWTFADRGVSISQPGREARAEWEEFTGWRTVGRSLLLHTAPTRYAVIPWRDVAEGERPVLEGLLAERIGPCRR